MDTKMKALRYLSPGRLELQELPLPSPQAGEVLLRVRACGICGSDVHGYLGLTGRRIAPMTMGHEFSAEVVEPGTDVEGFCPGDGVIVQPINFCGTCVNCRQGLTNMCLDKKFFGVLTVDGAFAQYLSVPSKLLYRLPKGCSYAEGALAEPYAVAYGAVKKAGDDCLRGKDVLIIGAGTIGLCILQLVKLHAPRQVIVSDLSGARLSTAMALGADSVVNSGKEGLMETVARLTGGGMIDTSIEAVGVETTANQSIKTLKPGGTVVWVGMSQKQMQINMQDIVCSARRVLGSFNYTHGEFGEVVSLLGTGKLDCKKLITRMVSLEESSLYFEELHNRPDAYIKVLVDPTR